MHTLIVPSPASQRVGHLWRPMVSFLSAFQKNQEVFYLQKDPTHLRGTNYHPRMFSEPTHHLNPPALLTDPADTSDTLNSPAGCQG